MGNFYTNFSIVGSDVETVIEFAKNSRREAFVVQGRCGVTVMYDQMCDEQDVEEIERLGVRLSSECSVPVIACLNHDDDHLHFWIFEDGKRKALYRSSLDSLQFSWSLSRICGGFLAYPLIVIVLGWPLVLLQFWRHAALVRVLSLPKCAVGYGFRYLERGEIPSGLSEDDIRRV